MSRRLSAFFGAAVGTAAIVVGVWGVWLLLDPPETRHLEYAIPALFLATAGTITAIVHAAPLTPAHNLLR